MAFVKLHFIGFVFGTFGFHYSCVPRWLDARCISLFVLRIAGKDTKGGQLPAHGKFQTFATQKHIGIARSEEGAALHVMPSIGDERVAIPQWCIYAVWEYSWT